MTASDTINHKRAIEYLQANNIEYTIHSYGRIRVFTSNGTIDYWPNRGTTRIKGEFEIKRVQDIKQLISQ